MANDAVVVGGGPGGLRAAILLAKAGRAVTLLQEGPFAGGAAHPDIPLGRGVGPTPGALGESLYGSFRPVEADRAVLFGGRVHALPLSRSEVARSLSIAKLGPAAVAWGRTRGAGELRKIIGGGQELRTYEDWVVQRFGRPVFEQLYAEYCEVRFGPPEEVSCSVARRVHGLVDDAPLTAPEAGPALSTVGVDVRTNVAVRSVTTGQVETDDGIFTGEVFLDITPRRVTGWLGEAASEQLVNDTGFLHTRHLLQVLLRSADVLPYETHVLGGAPFYRITQPGLLPGCGALAGQLCVHYALHDGDPLLTSEEADVGARAVDALAAVGLTGCSAEGARVQVVRDHHPTWVNNHLVRMRRYVLALEELEIVPVGRAGLHAPLDLASELAWMAGLLAEERPSLRSLARAHVEPPVLDPEERAHLTRFVER